MAFDLSTRPRREGPLTHAPLVVDDQGAPDELLAAAAGAVRMRRVEPPLTPEQVVASLAGKDDLAEARAFLETGERTGGTYEAETARIKASKETARAKGVHRFKAAEWTHPNGHPRCAVCGQEESISPECNREATPAERKEFDDYLASEFPSTHTREFPVSEAILAMLVEEGAFWDPEKHPRWPKGTPLAGEFMRVGQRFELGGKEYDVTSVMPGKIHANVATKGQAAGAKSVSFTDAQLAKATRPAAEGIQAATKQATSASASGGKAGTATVIDPYVSHAAAHDPSIPIPEAAKAHMSPEAWKRFGQLDQERYSQLMERFGAWSPGKSGGLIQQALAAEHDSAVKSAVTSGYASQKGSSQGLSLGLHQIFGKAADFLKGSSQAEKKRAEFEKARALQHELASAMQWDLYNRAKAPDVSLFHKHSDMARFEKVASGQLPVFSGLSMSQHYRHGWWSNGCFATPMAIRHIVMSTISGNVTSGFESEQEVATADPFHAESGKGAMVWSDSQFASGKAKWLESQTKGAASGEVLEMLHKSNTDPNFELPIPPPAPEIHLASQGGKSYKEPPPDAIALPKKWGTKTNASGETVADVPWFKPDKNGDPTPLEANKLRLVPGDYIQGNPKSLDKGTTYVIVADPSDGYMGLAYYKVTEPDGVTPYTGSEQAFHFEGGGTTKFKKIDAHFDVDAYEKAQAEKSGQAQFNPEAWTETAEQKKVGQLPQGTKFKVHGVAYETYGEPGSATVKITQLDTGDKGTINGDYKTPTLTLKPGFTEAGTPAFDPAGFFKGEQKPLSALGAKEGDVVQFPGVKGAPAFEVTKTGETMSGKALSGDNAGKEMPLPTATTATLMTPKPLGWTNPVAGDTLAIDGKKAKVTKVMKDGTVQINTSPGVLKVKPDDPILAGIFSPSSHDLGDKVKVKTLEPGQKFHGGTGAALRPYMVVKQAGSKTTVRNLDTGEESVVSAQRSFAQLVPKAAPAMQPAELGHVTPGPEHAGVASVDPLAYENAGKTFASDLAEGDYFQKNGQSYVKVAGAYAKNVQTGETTMLGNGDEVTKLQPKGTLPSALHKSNAVHLMPKPTASPTGKTPWSEMPVGTHFQSYPEAGVPGGPVFEKTAADSATNTATGDKVPIPADYPQEYHALAPDDAWSKVFDEPAPEPKPGVWTKHPGDITLDDLKPGDKFAASDPEGKFGTSQKPTVWEVTGAASDGEKPIAIVDSADPGAIGTKTTTSSTFAPPYVMHAEQREGKTAKSASDLELGDHFTHGGIEYVVNSKSSSGGVFGVPTTGDKSEKEHVYMPPSALIDKLGADAPTPGTPGTGPGDHLTQPSTFAALPVGGEFAAHDAVWEKTGDSSAKITAILHKNQSAPLGYEEPHFGVDDFVEVAPPSGLEPGVPPAANAPDPPAALPGTAYDPSAYVKGGEKTLGELGVGDIFVGGMNGKHYLVTKTGAKSGLTALDLQTGKVSSPWGYEKKAAVMHSKAAGAVAQHDDLTPGDPVTLEHLGVGDHVQLAPAGKSQVYEIVSKGEEGEAPQVQLAPVNGDYSLGAPGTANTHPLAVVTFHQGAKDVQAAKDKLAAQVDAGTMAQPDKEIDPSFLPDAGSHGLVPYSQSSKTGGGHFYTKAKLAGQDTLLKDKSGKVWKVVQPGSYPIVTDGKEHFHVDGDNVLKVANGEPFDDVAPPLPGASVQDTAAAAAHAAETDVPGGGKIGDLVLDKGDTFTTQFASGKYAGTWEVMLPSSGSVSGDVHAMNIATGKTQTFGPAHHVASSTKAPVTVGPSRVSKQVDWKTNLAPGTAPSHDPNAVTAGALPEGTKVKGVGGTVFEVGKGSDATKASLTPLGDVHQGDGFYGSGALEVGKPIEVDAGWKPSAIDAEAQPSMSVFGNALKLGDHFLEGGEVFEVTKGATKASDGSWVSGKNVDTGDTDQFDSSHVYEKIAGPDAVPVGATLYKDEEMMGGDEPEDSFASSVAPYDLAPNTTGQPVGSLSVGDHFQTESGSVLKVAEKSPGGSVVADVVHGVLGDGESPGAPGQQVGFGPTFTPAGIVKGDLPDAGAAAKGLQVGDPVQPGQVEPGMHIATGTGHLYSITSVEDVPGKPNSVMVGFKQAGTDGTEWEGKLPYPKDFGGDSTWVVAEKPFAPDDEFGSPDLGAAENPKDSPLSAYSPKSQTGGGHTYGVVGQLSPGTLFTDKTGAKYEKVGEIAGQHVFKDVEGIHYVGDPGAKVKLSGSAKPAAAHPDAWLLKKTNVMEDAGTMSGGPGLFNSAYNEGGEVVNHPIAGLAPGDKFVSWNGDRCEVVGTSGPWTVFVDKDMPDGGVAFKAKTGGAFYVKPDAG